MYIHVLVPVQNSLLQLHLSHTFSTIHPPTSHSPVPFSTMADAQPPLTWEGSASSTHPTISESLPEEVVTCLQNARFVRLPISCL